MSETVTMYLIRHGATVQNESRPVILQGNGIDGDLSETGRRQAASVGQFLAKAPLSAIYASRMRRAQQTAGHIAEHHRLDVETVPGIEEIGVGDWEGLSWPAIMEREPERYAAFMEDPTVGYPNGESFAKVLGRAETAFCSLFERHAGESIAVVAHNVVNRVYLSQLLGIDLQRSRHVKQMNCCVNVVRARRGIAEVVALNSVFHLPEW